MSSHDHDQSRETNKGFKISRRGFGRRAVPILGGAVVGSALLPGRADAATAPWNLTGNAGTAATNFLGTTDAKPLVVKTSNTERVRVTSTGDMGVGNTAPGARLHVTGAAAVGLFVRTPTTGTTPALKAVTNSTAANAIALHGVVSSASAGSYSAAVRGENSGTGAAGIGVWGSQAGSGVGMYAAAGNNGTGLVATASGNGYGLSAYNDSAGSGAGGYLRGDTVGLGAVANNKTGTAVLAQNDGGAGHQGSAVRGYSGTGARDRVHPSGGYFDAAGEFSGPNGVIGAASPDSTSGYGVLGLANNTSGVAVYASGSGGATAMLAVGDVDVFGTLTKSGGSFRIDHPLAPADRYLSHSFVESPDMKNVYDGVAVTDAKGQASVTMPDWFEALNRDLRFQLTAIGGPAPELHVAVELKDGKFVIGGAKPKQKISWQVTGIRQDAWAQAHRIPVDEPKPAADKGRYLHPELFAAPASKQVGALQGTFKRAPFVPAKPQLQD